MGFWMRMAKRPIGFDDEDRELVREWLPKETRQRLVEEYDAAHHFFAELRRMDQPEPKLRLAVIERDDKRREVPAKSEKLVAARKLPHICFWSVDDSVNQAGELIAVLAFAIEQVEADEIAPAEVLIELHCSDLTPALCSMMTALGFQVEVCDHPESWYEEQLATLKGEVPHSKGETL